MDEYDRAVSLYSPGADPRFYDVPLVCLKLRYHLLAGAFYFIGFRLIQTADFFQKSAFINGCYLGDDHNTRFGQIRNSFFQADVARHSGQLHV